MSSNNFYISDINGRYNSLLKESDYTALKGCKTLEEMIVKLNHYFGFINEDMGYDELRMKFVQNVLFELDEFENNELVYFIRYYMICNFFNKIEGIKEHILGNFPELKVLNLCRNFDDVQKLCINNCFLLRYFRDIKSFEGQKTMLIVLKNLMDEVYINSKGYFKEILEHEGDRQILEICLSGKGLQDKIKYFPKATTLGLKQLEKLSSTTEVEEIKRIFYFNDEEPIEAIIKRLSNVYAESFAQYNDSSCIYAYFKLKEQEIENIMWIVECMLQNAPEKMDEIILFNN